MNRPPMIAILVAAFQTFVLGAVQSATASSHVPLNTLRFDEIPFQSVDDLSFAGVSFDFKVDGVDSFEAFYNSFGPGSQPGVDDPSLTGDSSGILDISFSIPSSVVEFVIALNTAEPLMPGFRVELFDANMTLLNTAETDVMNVGGPLGFSEGHFTYSGTPVSRAVIDFIHEPGSFALDNLTYQIVPESSTALLGVIALMGLANRRKRVPLTRVWALTR